ncbi:hypothetical protein N7453_003209 [Penicillium expansum]|nr:hypothetical protein N7453_003209 [Penicillium expansum]
MSLVTSMTAGATRSLNGGGLYLEKQSSYSIASTLPRFFEGLKIHFISKWPWMRFRLKFTHVGAIVTALDEEETKESREGGVLCSWTVLTRKE